MERLRTPDVLAGVFGLALLVSLFTPWYEVAGTTVSATKAFGFVDLWLLLVAGLALALPVVTAVKDAPALPVAVDVLTTWAALVGLLLVLFRTLNLPGPHGVDRDWGLWLGLAATLGTLASAYMAVRIEAAPGLRPNPEPQVMPAPPA
jgi:hypothetical protein